MTEQLQLLYMQVHLGKTEAPLSHLTFVLVNTLSQLLHRISLSREK